MNGNIQMVGNAALMALPKTAFLSSRKVAPQDVMWCYDWATGVRDMEKCIMGSLAPLIRTAVCRNSSEHIHCPFPVSRESGVYYSHATTEWNDDEGEASRENKVRGRRGVRRWAGVRSSWRGDEIPRAG